MSALLSIAMIPVGCTVWPVRGARPSQVAEETPSAGSLRPLVEYRYPDAPPVLDAEGLRAFVGRFKQHVVVLDFWASRSRRSRVEISELARIQERFEDEGCQVISCNLDEPGCWSTQTVPILQGAGATFPCVVIRHDAKPAIRAWLAPEWSYDLPARFIMDRRGQVVVKALSATPVQSVERQVCRLSQMGSDTARVARLPDGAVALRVKLIDVRAGRGESIPEVAVETADPRRLASQVADIMASRIDRTANPRIAIVPFAASNDRRRAQAFGLEAARRVVEALRRRGHHDLITPERAQRMIDDARMTPMAIEFDPSQIQRRFPCDFIVIGWLRGNVDGLAPQRAQATDGVQTAVAPAAPRS
ncbi:MAG: redoxin domain-containing protein [Phycisphaerae bacterium]|nr:redoxin domain-containing protein [Phycisphaerae bacterium]